MTCNRNPGIRSNSPSASSTRSPRGGLSVRTTATNTGREACPYGAGQHPYVTVGAPTVDSAILLAPGRTVLHVDERGLPVGTGPVDGTEYDFRRPRPIGATKLDHAFTDLERGADGCARVELRDPTSRAGLTLWVDESYRYVQLFTGDPLPDVARRSLAVEPMTCPPNAFRTGEDLIRLGARCLRHERLGHRPRVITEESAGGGPARLQRSGGRCPPRAGRSGRPAPASAC